MEMIYQVWQVIFEGDFLQKKKCFNSCFFDSSWSGQYFPKDLEGLNDILKSFFPFGGGGGNNLHHALCQGGCILSALNLQRNLRTVTSYLEDIAWDNILT